MARVLVTGGAGYIGSHVVRALLDHGYTVQAVDNLSTGHSQSIPSDVLIRGDAGDAELLDRVLGGEEWDAVIHLAAFSTVAMSVSDPLRYYKNNVSASITLLDAMLRHGVKTMVFSSSAAVYGEPQQVPIPEDHPLQPVNPYGETKLAVERLLEACRVAHGLRYVALRYFNAAGASDTVPIGECHEPETHLVPLAIEAGVKGSALPVFGRDYPTQDGTCVRDFIHVCDLAEAHCVALERLLAHEDVSGCYNLGTGVGHSVLDVVKAVEREVGRGVQIVDHPRRIGDPAVLVADASRFRTVFQWAPRHASLEDIVGSAVRRWDRGVLPPLGTD